MLDYKQKYVETAIEVNVCQQIEKSKKHELDAELFAMFGVLMQASGKKTGVIPEKEKPPLFKMIEKRIDAYHTFTITDQRLLLILTAVATTPGKAVLYLWYIQYWCYRNNVRELDLETFSQSVFPHGFPSDESLQEIWEGQKVNKPDTDGTGARIVNLVDYANAGLSMQFKINKT